MKREVKFSHSMEYENWVYSQGNRSLCRANDHDQQFGQQGCRGLGQAKRLARIVLFNRTAAHQLFHVSIDRRQRDLALPDQLLCCERTLRQRLQQHQSARMGTGRQRLNHLRHLIFPLQRRRHDPKQRRCVAYTRISLRRVIRPFSHALYRQQPAGLKTTQIPAGLLNGKVANCRGLRDRSPFGLQHMRKNTESTLICQHATGTPDCWGQRRLHDQIITLRGV